MVNENIETWHQGDFEYSVRATLIALSNTTPTDDAWFIDGMAAIRAADTKPTYKEFFLLLQ